MSARAICGSIKHGPAWGGVYVLTWLADQAARNFWRIRFTDIEPDCARLGLAGPFLPPFCGSYKPSGKAVLALVDRFARSIPIPGEAQVRRALSKI